MQSYDLTLAAEEDLRDIWRYTYETWGFEQAETYFDRIEACCEAVGDRRTGSGQKLGVKRPSLGVKRTNDHRERLLW